MKQSDRELAIKTLRRARRTLVEKGWSKDKFRVPGRHTWWIKPPSSGTTLMDALCEKWSAFGALTAFRLAAPAVKRAIVHLTGQRHDYSKKVCISQWEVNRARDIDEILRVLEEAENWVDYAEDRRDPTPDREMEPVTHWDQACDVTRWVG